MGDVKTVAAVVAVVMLDGAERKCVRCSRHRRWWTLEPCWRG
jgi:hypothetical protein